MNNEWPVIKLKHSPTQNIFDIFNDNNFSSFLQREAEYGIIEKVSIKNFICHGSLEVSLGPHVNFIVGRNGSKFHILCSQREDYIEWAVKTKSILNTE